ncbi:MAG: hypothetical protein JRJ12_12285 [Deltaproteobacteria bacterium]|nr:hypothetical protein [Deltaproteobacteria bacterium]MBW2070000.1 hypothetical protein [Deltaproteobacteria bacterium]
MNKRRQDLRRLAQQFSIHIIYAFGSYARQVAEWMEGKAGSLSIPAGSDLDIGVKPQKSERLHVTQKVALAQALEDLFSVSRVDLVVLPEADPFVAANIIRGERLYAQDEYLADEYDLYILRRAGDLAPLERERMALILGEDE